MLGPDRAVRGAARVVDRRKEEMVAGAEGRAERLDELFAEEARGAVAVRLVVDPEGAARAQSLERGLILTGLCPKSS
jgi:hypothetical protein